MQAQACKGKAKLAVLAHELLTLDLSLPTSSVRAAQAVRLQREASIARENRRARGTRLPNRASLEGVYRGGQVEGLAGRNFGRWCNQRSFARSYSASAAVALETQEPHVVEFATRRQANHPSSAAELAFEDAHHAETFDKTHRRTVSASDVNLLDDPLNRLQYAVRCLNAPSNVRSTPLDVARLYFALPNHQQAALPMKTLRQIFRAIVKAVLDQRSEDAIVKLQRGLRTLPIKQFLERFSDSAPDNRQLHPNNVNEVLLLWIKALLLAEMPDVADDLYSLARSNGHLGSDKLNMDEIVGPLVVLQEWGLILKWTKGRMCSVGVHAMRMRAFSALGTPQMAIADYEQHEEQLRAEHPTLLEAMKAYYMTRDFTRGNSIRKELVLQGRTYNRQYISAMITAVRYLGFTPLMEKTIIKDLQHNGSTFQHVPLLNLLLKQRIQDGLRISPIIEMYPVAQGASETLDGQPPILLDQHTVALMMEDQRSFSDINQLRSIWTDVLSNLPETQIGSHLVAALVKSLLRLNQEEEALQLLRDIATRQSSSWIDRPTELHAGVFNPLIGYLTRLRGIDAATPVFGLMQSSGCHPNGKTVSTLVDGLAQHQVLQPSVRDALYDHIVQALPSQLRAGVAKSQLGHGVRTALRNHALQQELQSLPDGRSAEDTTELSNLFEWKHLSKHPGLAASDKNANLRSQIAGPSYWAGAKSPTPAAIFAAAVAKGFPLDVPTCQTILQLYIARGHLARAQEIMLLSWQRGIIPSMDMWAIFVKGLADANQLEFLGRRIDAMRRDATSNGLSAAFEARSMSLAALMPNQATLTRIIEELIAEGTFRQACQLAKYALSSASRIGEDPDVGLLAVSFEAFIRAKHTRKARDLLRDPPVGYGPTLRAAVGPEKTVLLKAVRRARAWHAKHQDLVVANDIDAFLQSMPSTSRAAVGDVQVSAEELVEGATGKDVKRTGLTLGELKGLEEKIGHMFNSLWPNTESIEDGYSAYR